MPNKTTFVANEELFSDVASYLAAHYTEEQTEEPVDNEEYVGKNVAQLVQAKKSQSVTRRTTTKRRESRYLEFISLKAERKLPERETDEQSEVVVCNTAPVTPAHSSQLDDLVGNLDEPFSATLLRLIDAKGKTDVEVYRRANLDRRLFSKIRTTRGYVPSKRTIMALAVALELNLTETDDLLKRAGYALSHSQKFDVIIEYFIASGNYDIFVINEVLFQYDQPLLGG